MLEKVAEATKLFSQFNASALKLGDIIFERPSYHQGTRVRVGLGQNAILATMKCVAEKLEKMLEELDSHPGLIHHETFVPEMYGLYSFLVNAIYALMVGGAPVKATVTAVAERGIQEFGMFLEANKPNNRN
ncbi:MAG: hypothetical protein A3J55_03260 [Candidatus Ryanbacteria bacterium RIFCSPHIGHO2_02_FULL_45_17b]|uniref:Uncharacterized protein n=1 Tax=Candidatus Ryanbacteria bacterium RIFCSPHIGHO2_01_FULL_45_22 TaxID=1802114 RepID=A0A1G2G1X0_9BACT|nr:MAG: hypothetical protein A2719_04460 [Candidatus Ryanbacteria bacterium RIFCSPHIGHO2_01_FULL_45_22]OGZ47480.1 MAG: hypothetical protein A3J55_03260 [Candidatus Ryanbacteria bacterium RIFCSPHIGHO2_02_FULL_45_17b]